MLLVPPDLPAQLVQRGLRVLRVPPDLPGLRVLLGLRDLPARKGHRGLPALPDLQVRRELQGRQARLVPLGLLALRGQLVLRELLDPRDPQALPELALLVLRAQLGRQVPLGQRVRLAAEELRPKWTPTQPPARCIRGASRAGPNQSRSLQLAQVVAVVVVRDQAPQQTELAAVVLVVLLALRFFIRRTQFRSRFMSSSEPLGLRAVEDLRLPVVPVELGATARLQLTTPIHLLPAFMP